MRLATGARKFHEAEGIDCRMVVKPDLPTGTAGILVNSHGQNEIIVSLDANNALTPADIDAHDSYFFNYGLILVTQLEANLTAEAEAMRLAQEHRMTVILNPAPMRDDFDAALLANVDILIPNETEFCALANLLPQTRPTVGTNFDERALENLSDAELHALCRWFGVETIIVTLGARGVFCFATGRSRPDPRRARNRGGGHHRRG